MQKKDIKELVNNLDYAFQPIINPNTGITFAFEALLRGFEKIDYVSANDFFDDCHKHGTLGTVEIFLRKKMFEKFASIPFHKQVKLFYNYDYRINDIDGNGFKYFLKLFDKYGVNPDMFCLEISEKNRIESIGEFKLFLRGLRQKRINIALDDFGAGYAGLEIFYYSDPNYLKFDRFLIEKIDSDFKKKSFCSHILGLTKLLGIFSVAEGIESINEFNVCREIGFELVQGFFIQEPSTSAEDLKLCHENIRKNNRSNRRRTRNDSELISREIKKLETISINDSLTDVIKKFHNFENHHFFPVLDSNDFPLGIIHEKHLKRYLYSPFGQDLLKYKKILDAIENFIYPCPISDINTKQEKILEIIVNNPDCEGVLIIRDLKYEGFLTAKSLLNIINENNLKEARELNPLTKLPGNMLIDKFIYRAYYKKRSVFYIIYFDFDYFKPFNDRFGFRQGDRVISLFADMLRKAFNAENHFIGHIGGDDFFLGIEDEGENLEKYREKTANLIEKFSGSVSSFYSAEECRDRRYVSKDRLGNICSFPLLSATAIIMELPKGKRLLTIDELAAKIASLKKEARISSKKVDVFSLSGYVGDTQLI